MKTAKELLEHTKQQQRKQVFAAIEDRAKYGDTCWRISVGYTGYLFMTQELIEELRQKGYDVSKKRSTYTVSWENINSCMD